MGKNFEEEESLDTAGGASDDPSSSAVKITTSLSQSPKPVSSTTPAPLPPTTTETKSQPLDECVEIDMAQAFKNYLKFVASLKEDERTSDIFISQHEAFTTFLSDEGTIVPIPNSDSRDLSTEIDRNRSGGHSGFQFRTEDLKKISSSLSARFGKAYLQHASDPLYFFIKFLISPRITSLAESGDESAAHKIEPKYTEKNTCILSPADTKNESEPKYTTPSERKEEDNFAPVLHFDNTAERLWFENRYSISFKWSDPPTVFEVESETEFFESDDKKTFLKNNKCLVTSPYGKALKMILESPTLIGEFSRAPNETFVAVSNYLKEGYDNSNQLEMILLSPTLTKAFCDEPRQTWWMINIYLEAGYHDVKQLEMILLSPTLTKAFCDKPRQTWWIVNIYLEAGYDDVKQLETIFRDSFEAKEKSQAISYQEKSFEMAISSAYALVRREQQQPIDLKPIIDEFLCCVRYFNQLKKLGSESGSPFHFDAEEIRQIIKTAGIESLKQGDMLTDVIDDILASDELTIKFSTEPLGTLFVTDLKLQHDIDIFDVVTKNENFSERLSETFTSEEDKNLLALIDALYKTLPEDTRLDITARMFKAFLNNIGPYEAKPLSKKLGGNLGDEERKDCFFERQEKILLAATYAPTYTQTKPQDKTVHKRNNFDKMLDSHVRKLQAIKREVGTRSKTIKDEILATQSLLHAVQYIEHSAQINHTLKPEQTQGIFDVIKLRGNMLEVGARAQANKSKSSSGEKEKILTLIRNIFLWLSRNYLRRGQRRKAWGALQANKTETSKTKKTEQCDGSKLYSVSNLSDMKLGRFGATALAADAIQARYETSRYTLHPPPQEEEKREADRGADRSDVPRLRRN